MLFPKKVKHRKWHRGRGRRRDPIATAGTTVSFGDFGLKALDASWVTARQLEAARRAIARHVKRGGKIWIRVFPDRPVTFHGNENPMGGGKGAVDHYVVPVKPGAVLFEMGGVTEEIAQSALRLASYKLPVRTRFVKKVL
ncbi:50S ribosomal protein L16 [Candidatus Uhrbacteria bacterium]|nr:50S ribosomal protein L16 [Candidatus Uhrbacteria bacterium]